MSTTKPGSGAMVPVPATPLRTAAGGARYLAPITRVEATHRVTRLRREVIARGAVVQGVQLLHPVAQAVLDELHETTHRGYVATAAALVARRQDVRDPEVRRLVDDFTADQLAMLKRHKLAALEAAAYQVASMLERPVYEAEEERGFLARLLFGE